MSERAALTVTLLLLFDAMAGRTLRERLLGSAARTGDRRSAIDVEGLPRRSVTAARGPIEA